MTAIRALRWAVTATGITLAIWGFSTSDGYTAVVGIVLFTIFCPEPTL